MTFIEGNISKSRIHRLTHVNCKTILGGILRGLFLKNGNCASRCSPWSFRLVRQTSTCGVDLLTRRGLIRSCVQESIKSRARGMGGHLPPTPPPPLVMDRSGIASRYGAAAAAPRMRGGAALDLQAILGLSMTTGARAVARGRYPAGCGGNFPRSARGYLSLFESNMV